MYVIICPITCSSRCIHDMGTLSWLNAETLKRVPTPLVGRLVRCSAYGRDYSKIIICSLKY